MSTPRTVPVILLSSVLAAAIWFAASGLHVLAQIPSESERISVTQERLSSLSDRVAKIEASVERLETEKRITKIEASVSELIERSRATQKWTAAMMLSILGMFGKSLYSVAMKRERGVVVKP